MLPLALFAPALIGGFMYVGHELDAGRKAEISDLFRAFKQKGKINDFLIIGAISLGLNMLAELVSMGFGVGGILMGVAAGGDPGPGVFFSLFIILVLLLTAAFAIIMLQFYSVPLVMLDNAKPLDAMKSSFFACLRNFLPLTVLSLVILIPLIIAMIPLGLGMIVLAPILYMVQYSSFKDIYH